MSSWRQRLPQKAHEGRKLTQEEQLKAAPAAVPARAHTFPALPRAFLARAHAFRRSQRWAESAWRHSRIHSLTWASGADAQGSASGPSRHANSVVAQGCHPARRQADVAVRRIAVIWVGEAPQIGAS